MGSTPVFLSYSSKDRGLVTAVRRLLSAANDCVFQDCESIKPGTAWEHAIDDAIARSGSMYVFWCRHADHSKEVRKEYLAAVRRGLPVVPVLLDKTPLRPELAAFQGVDFRDVAVHPRFSRAVRAVAGFAAVLLMLGVTPVFLLMSSSHGVGAPQEKVARSPMLHLSWIIPAVLICLLAWLRIRKQRQRRALAQQILQHVQTRLGSTAHNPQAEQEAIARA